MQRRIAYVRTAFVVAKNQRRHHLLAEDIKMGDIKDVKNFMNAVIDQKAFDNITSYIDYAKQAPDAQILAGGQYDKSQGYLYVLLLWKRPIRT